MGTPRGACENSREPDSGEEHTAFENRCGCRIWAPFIVLKHKVEFHRRRLQNLVASLLRLSLPRAAPSTSLCVACGRMTQISVWPDAPPLGLLLKSRTVGEISTKSAFRVRGGLWSQTRLSTSALIILSPTSDRLHTFLCLNFFLFSAVELVLQPWMK